MRLYWLRFEDLSRVVGIDPSTHMTPFINGVKSKRIREAIRVEWSRTHDSAKVIELADQMEMGEEMERLREEEMGSEESASEESFSASDDATGSETEEGHRRNGRKRFGKPYQRPPRFSKTMASPASAFSPSGTTHHLPSSPVESAATRLASQ